MALIDGRMDETSDLSDNFNVFNQTVEQINNSFRGVFAVAKSGYITVTKPANQLSAVKSVAHGLTGIAGFKAYVDNAQNGNYGLLPVFGVGTNDGTEQGTYDNAGRLILLISADIDATNFNVRVFTPMKQSDEYKNQRVFTIKYYLEKQKAK